LLLSLDCTVYLLGWNLAFFGDAMGKHYGGFPRKEIENSVVNALVACPQFKDCVSKVIRLRPAKFVSHFRKAADSGSTLELNFPRQLIEPLQQRKQPVRVSVKIDFGSGQAGTFLCSHFW
jgi:hypothetical protein